MKRFLMTLALGVAVAVPTMANANAIDVTRIALPHYKQVKISYSGAPSISPFWVKAGQIDLRLSTRDVLKVWCTDIFDYARTGTYTPGPLVTNRDGIGDALSSAQIGRIGGLIVAGDQMLTSGGRLTHGYNRDEVSAGIQTAIWQIEYGADFDFSSRDKGLAGLVATYVADAEAGTFTPTSDVVELIHNNHAQGLSTATPHPVPEPGSLLLLASSLCGLCFMRRRSRR